LFLDEAGKQQPAVMGSYGIGVTRTLQAVIEQSHDKDGIVWPLAVAPYAVCITPLSVAPESPVFQLAQAIHKALMEKGIEVLLDDRDERPGVKFKDADLVGFPLRLGIGEKSLARGEVELKPRGGAMMAVRSEEAVSKVVEWLDQL
jgi:prolyl-tRNA synthetase